MLQFKLINREFIFWYFFKISIHESSPSVDILLNI